MVVWIYDSSDKDLRTKLQGMEFDRAIIDRAVRSNTNVKVAVFERVRPKNSKTTNAEHLAISRITDLLSKSAPNGEFRQAVGEAISDYWLYSKEKETM